MGKFLFINHSTLGKIILDRNFFVLVVATVVLFIVYLGYKESTVIIDSTAFRLRGGLYRVNIPFAEISKIDTIAWSEVPAFIRTNGISLFLVHRGHFKTTYGDKLHLSIKSGVSPVIKIIDQQGIVYYINHKNSDKTRLVFKELNTLLIENS